MSRASLTITALLGSAVLVAGTNILKPLPALAGAGSCHPNYGSLGYEPAKCQLDQNPFCVNLAGCVAASVACNDGTGSFTKAQYTRVVASGNCVADTESGNSCTQCEVYICAEGYAMDDACEEQQCDTWKLLSQKC